MKIISPNKSPQNTEDIKKANTRVFLKLWIPIVLAYGSVIIFGGGIVLYYCLLKHDSLPMLNLAGITIGFIIFCLAIFKIGRWHSNRKIHQYLQSQSPDELISYFRKTSIGPTGIADALFVYSSSLAYIIYGDYSSARLMLQSIDWKLKPPYAQAWGKRAEALLCYLDTGTYELGLELARTAKKMVTTSKIIPGIKMDAAIHESYIEIGEILCNRSTPSIIKSLEKKVQKSLTFNRLVIVWGLAIAFRKAGEESKASQMQAYLHQTAPYCKAFKIQ